VIKHRSQKNTKNLNEIK